MEREECELFVIHYGLKMSKGTEYEWDKHFEYAKSETEKDKLKWKGKSKRFVSSVRSRFVFDDDRSIDKVRGEIGWS